MKNKKQNEPDATGVGPVTPEVVDKRRRRHRAPQAQIGVAISADGSHRMISVMAEPLDEHDAQQAIRGRLGRAGGKHLGSALCVPGPLGVSWLALDLSADDAEDFAQVAAALLDRAGYEVTVCADVSDYPVAEDPRR